MNFFYYSICHVCKKPGTNLKKCAKCKLLHYCNRDHQVKDWPKHKAYCKVMMGSREFLNFTPGSGPAPFNKFKLQQAILWQFDIGRPLETFEHEMWMFPKVCAICYASDVSIVCQNCWSVAYCHEEHQIMHNEHANFCQALRLCLAVHQGLEKNSSNTWIKGKFDFSKDIQVLPETIEDMVKLINNIDFSEKPIEVAIATDYFSTPVSILYALEKSRLLDKRQGKRTKLVIHVANAELNYITDWPHIMEFLSHWICNLKKIQIYIVTSENEADESVLFKQDCEFCRKKNFEGSVTFVKGDYEDYVEKLPHPDVILLFGGRVPELKSFEWGETMQKLLQFKAVPIVVTGNVKPEVEHELAKFAKCVVRFYLGLEENKYGSKRPVRNCDTGADPVVYRNRYIAILARK